MFNVIFILLRRVQMPLIVLIAAYAIAMLGFVLIPGQDAQGNPWPMSFMHAFYVVTYTATTIGFGELPYPFTDAQRMWVTFTIYVTVIAWMYAIGVLLALVQDTALRALIKQYLFARSARRMVEPFYLVCGYGDTGTSVVRGLADVGLRTVVLDVDPARIDALLLEDLPLHVPGLRADAGKPDTLALSGLKSRYCAGVLALTDNDQTNVQIAIAVKLLRPEMPVIARAETADAAASLASFGTDYILNPFDLFARILKHALHAPSLYALDERLTSVPHEAWSPPLYPPRGHWLVCGYGRFGHAMREALLGEGITCTVIEADAEIAATVPGCLRGRGTETRTLLDADARNAQALIAGTDNDANNLAVVMTARELNPQLFIVARQNHHDNDAIFRAARVPLIMQRGRVLAGEVFSIVTSPLVVDFLRLAEREDEAWADALHRRVRAIMGERNPDRWTVDIRSREAPAISLAIGSGLTVRVGDLRRDPQDRDRELPGVALLLKRGENFFLLPADAETLHKGDIVLFCGNTDARRRMGWIAQNHNVFHYVHSGEERTSRLLDKLALRKARTH